MRIVVQKFGGTSLATAEGRERVVGWVQQAMREGYRVACVVSAMGRRGDPYATDTLLELLPACSADPSPRDQDLLLSCGEIISAAVMAQLLRCRGLPAAPFTGAQAGLVTDDCHGDAAILRVEPQRVLRALEEGKVAVVAGFQGMTERGEATTLGRGGSDTTAAALGCALRAEVVEIFTDVDGVKTADPRIVPSARTLSVATYDETAQMAHFGARVIHPRAVEIAMQRSIPIRIKSTWGEGPGTLITYTAEAAGAGWSELRDRRTVTAVAQIPGLAQVVVEPAGDLALFRALAEAGISVDLINVSQGVAAFCIEEGRAERARTILSDIGLQPRIKKGCAKVSVIGSGMRGRPGVMATVVEGLRQAGVEILQTADSHVTISCLVEAADMERAVQALHDAFNLAD